MITADESVKEICDYIKSFLTNEDDIKVFEYEDKPKSYKGAYIAVNALPFVYGYAVNDRCRLNINIHVPDKSDGTFYRAKYKRWGKFISEIFPKESAYEEDGVLQLENASYCITNVSQPRRDIDNTHYVNYQLKVISVNN